MVLISSVFAKGLPPFFPLSQTCSCPCAKKIQTFHSGSSVRASSWANTCFGSVILQGRHWWNSKSCHNLAGDHQGSTDRQGRVCVSSASLCLTGAAQRGGQGRAGMQSCVSPVPPGCWTFGCTLSQSWSLAAFRYEGGVISYPCLQARQSVTQWQSSCAELECWKERLLPWLQVTPDRIVQVCY